MIGRVERDDLECCLCCSGHILWEKPFRTCCVEPGDRARTPIGPASFDRARFDSARLGSGPSRLDRLRVIIPLQLGRRSLRWISRQIQSCICLRPKQSSDWRSNLVRLASWTDIGRCAGLIEYSGENFLSVIFSYLSATRTLSPKRLHFFTSWL